MLNYIIRRLLLMVPTIIGITVLVFVIMAFSPGGLTAGLRSQEGNLRPEQRKIVEAYWNERYGLDQPLYKQYLSWLNHILPIGKKDAGAGWPKRWRVGFKAPDLGESSMRHRPVLEVVEEALPVTLLLNLITIPVIYAISITAGIYAAKRRGDVFDVAWGTTSLALWSSPRATEPKTRTDRPPWRATTARRSCRRD